MQLIQASFILPAHFLNSIDCAATALAIMYSDAIQLPRNVECLFFKGRLNACQYTPPPPKKSQWCEARTAPMKASTHSSDSARQKGERERVGERGRLLQCLPLTISLHLEISCGESQRNYELIAIVTQQKMF